MAFWKNTKKSSEPKDATKFEFSDEEINDATVLAQRTYVSFNKNPERFQWAFLARSAISAYTDAMYHGEELSRDVHILADATAGKNSISSLCELAGRIALMMILMDSDTLISLHGEYEVVIHDAIDDVIRSSTDEQ